jgi:phage tail sheath protein FI
MSETFLHGVKLLEVDSGTRPVRSVSSSVIGLVGTGNDDAVNAKVTIGFINSAILFTGIGIYGSGAKGNKIFISCGSGGAISSLNVIAEELPSGDVYISIIHATDSLGNNTTTASQVVALVNDANGLSRYLMAELAPSSNGSGIFEEIGAIKMSGGKNSTFPLDEPVLITSARDIDSIVGAHTYIGKSLEAIYKQSGAVVVVVRTNGVSGDATQFTGVYALKKSQAVLGVTPRIIITGDASGTISDVKSVLNSLRAIAFVGLSVNDYPTPASALAWQDLNGNSRIMTIWPSYNNMQDPSALAAGLQAKTDNDLGFWRSPSNQEVFGITSLDASVDFQMGDPTSLANVLNEGKVTTFIRRAGFRLWGNLTGSLDSKFQFLSVRRTADIINDSILNAHFWAIDRNIGKTYLSDVTESVNDYIKTLIALGAIVGGRCWPDPELNSPSELEQGKVYINFEFTPSYPAQTLIFRSIITNDYLTEIL